MDLTNSTQTNTNKSMNIPENSTGMKIGNGNAYITEAYIMERYETRTYISDNITYALWLIIGDALQLIEWFNCINSIENNNQDIKWKDEKIILFHSFNSFYS